MPLLRTLPLLLVVAGCGTSGVTSLPPITTSPPPPAVTVAPVTVAPTQAARARAVPPSPAPAATAAPVAAPSATQLPATLVGSAKIFPLTGSDDRFLLLPDAPPRRTDTTNRPLFINHGTGLVSYGGVLVSEVQAPALQAMMDALHAEGRRLHDISAIDARVGSGWRPDDLTEGQLYLDALRSTIAHGGYPAFPTSLEAMATSELSGAAYTAFEDALGRADGWTPATAQRLLAETGAFKAPRGTSAHHSGLAVDIDFPVMVDGRLIYHSENRDRNAAALHTVAGQWLYRFGPAFGYDTYDTDAEIWHWELRRWHFAS